MSERFYAIDSYNGNLVSVALQQIRIALDIYLVKRVFAGTRCCFNRLFSFFAEMTTWPAVNDDVSLCGSRLHRS